MPLLPGSKLGPYEILSKIGAGGMGEVYKARDSKLNREVAIKVLPASLANDADYLARFQREAQALAALHHPNIATIFGLEQNAIVMEYVEGAPLQGPLPIAELLPVAKQIAEALEAAHDKGIIHRDLKPANILLTPDGQVKILDFGLAKAIERTNISSANSPTLTLRATEAGLILGTAAYMAPEQAAGKPVDRRADIWSFGVILYELLTGKQLFDGETVSHTLAEVLKTEIDFNKIPAGPLRNLLQRCLDHNLKNRLQHIGEARFAIENYSANPNPLAATTKSSRLPWLLAAGLATALAALAVIYIRTGKPMPSPGIRFELAPPPNASFNSRVVLSPDGTKIAFSTRVKGDASAIWIRALNELEAHKLPGSEGAQNPVFWSPDSQSLAFSGSNLGKLSRIDLAGGQPQPLCTSSRNAPIGDWGKSGVILYRGAGGLMRVPASGGPCTLATAIDTKSREVEHSAPAFLPDGVHFLYLRSSADANLSGVFIGSLDKKPDQQDGNRLISTESGALFAPDPNDPASGYLIYRQRDTLLARPFHPGRLAFTGPAVALTEVSGPQGALAASVSENGILSYRNTPVERRNRIIAIDRAGTELEPITDSGTFNSLALSPDGKRLAFERGAVAGANTDIWVYDFERKSASRLTFDIDSEYGPIWTANGQSIIYASRRPGTSELFLRDASGAGKEIPLSLAGTRIRPSDASRDGRILLFAQEGNMATGADIHLAEFTNGGNTVTSPKPFLQTEFIERDGQFSPDGRYVSYTSNVTGRPEVFVRSINGEGQWMISTGVGGQARWSSDGKELFFLSADSKLIAVPINFMPSFRAGSPVPLFPVRGSGTGPAGTGLARWAVAPGSRKFYFIVAEEEATSPPAIIVTNWQAALQKR